MTLSWLKIKLSNSACLGSSRRKSCFLFIIRFFLQKSIPFKKTNYRRRVLIDLYQIVCVLLDRRRKGSNQSVGIRTLTAEKPHHHWKRFFSAFGIIMAKFNRSSLRRPRDTVCGILLVCGMLAQVHSFVPASTTKHLPLKSSSGKIWNWIEKACGICFCRDGNDLIVRYPVLV